MLKKTIKNLLGTIFILLIVISFMLFLYSYLNPCKIPIEYAIGNVDPRFDISSQKLLSTTKDAAERWNHKMGSNIFRYNPYAKLKINLVYDERQANLDNLKAQLKEINSSATSIEELKSQTETRINQYNQDLQAYDSEVNYWNSRGGAPSDVFNRLNANKASLDKRKKLIDQSTSLLNGMIEKHNNSVGEFNTENQKNNKLFTQGLYYQAEKKIDIFTFGNYEELRLVLMHEIGHSLSINHDLLDTSIMYPILEKQDIANPLPSSEDIEIINKACRIRNINYENSFFSLARNLSNLLPFGK